MKAVVAAFNQEKALVGAFSVITNLRMELFQALVQTLQSPTLPPVRRYSRSSVSTQLGYLAASGRNTCALHYNIRIGNLLKH